MQISCPFEHLDLFSGIGLFSYAADQVWNLEHIFCEIEDWPYRFLKQEYPNARIERDIKNFDGTEYAGRTFLLTAGVPCQPASVAGKRKGTDDNRWLWPETLRVLREAQPTWAIFENPDGIFTLEGGLVFESLLLEMESSGYEVQPYFVPACGVGAIHKRGRWWIVAKNTKRSINGRSKIKGGQTINRDTRPTNGTRNASNTSITRSGELSESERWDDSADIERSGGDIANSNRFNGNNAGHGSGEICGKLWEEAKIQECEDAANTTQQPKRKQANKENSISNGKEAWKELGGRDWHRPWPEVATELCRMDVSPSDRVHRLKALGNTIQWEVAAAIMQAIDSKERMVL